MCLCIYVDAYVCICTCRCMCMCICACTCRCMCTCMHVCIRIWRCKCTRVYRCRYVSMRVHACIDRERHHEIYVGIVLCNQWRICTRTTYSVFRTIQIMDIIGVGYNTECTHMLCSKMSRVKVTRSGVHTLNCEYVKLRKMSSTWCNIEKIEHRTYITNGMHRLRVDADTMWNEIVLRMHFPCYTRLNYPQNVWRV